MATPTQSSARISFCVFLFEKYLLDDLHLLKIAVSAVLTDERFTIETKEASLAADRLLIEVDS